MCSQADRTVHRIMKSFALPSCRSQEKSRSAMLMKKDTDKSGARGTVRSTR